VSSICGNIATLEAVGCVGYDDGALVTEGSDVGKSEGTLEGLLLFVGSMDGTLEGFGLGSLLTVGLTDGA